MTNFHSHNPIGRTISACAAQAIIGNLQKISLGLPVAPIAQKEASWHLMK
jgi:hypothetical protein